MFYMDVRYEGGTHGGTGAWEPDLILTDSESLIAAGRFAVPGQNKGAGKRGQVHSA